MHHDDAYGKEHRERGRARLRRAGRAPLALAAAARWHRRGGLVTAPWAG
jgi:hypothetical protein